MKNIFFIFLVFLLNHAYFQDNLSIVTSYDNVENRLSFKLISDVQQTVDSLFIDGVTHFERVDLYKNNGLYKMNIQCGSGCSAKKLLLLDTLDNKLIQSLHIYYLSHDIESFENPYDFNTYKYIDRDYIFNINDDNEALLQIKTTLSNKVSIESVNLYYIEQQKIYCTNSMDISDSFLFDNNTKIILSGRYYLIELPENTLIYLNNTWYFIDFKTKRIDSF